MRKETEATKIKMDGVIISAEEIIKYMRKNKQLSALIQDLIMKKELVDIELSPDEEDTLIKEYCINSGILDETELEKFLKINLIDKEIIREMVTLPTRVIRYREERWGHAVNSLYLKKKEKFDKVTYRRIESINPDIMQEVYFRLKDNEETWETMTQQFSPNDPNANSIKGPVSVSTIENEVHEALRNAGKNKLTRPITIGKNTIVAQLINFEASELNEQLRQEILREEFDDWLKTETQKKLNTILFES